MWIFTTAGYVSAVVDKTDESGATLLVRARDRQSLQTMCDGVELAGGEAAPDVIVGEGTDYPYRARVSRMGFTAWIAFEIEHYLDYNNFKSAAKVSLGDEWAEGLSRVWWDTHDFTDAEGERHSPYLSTVRGSGKRKMGAKR